MINFLNVGDNTIISVHPNLNEKLKKNGHNGKVIYVDYSSVKKLYGAAHCSTQVGRII